MSVLNHTFKIANKAFIISTIKAVNVYNFDKLIVYTVNPINKKLYADYLSHSNSENIIKDLEDQPNFRGIINIMKN